MATFKTSNLAKTPIDKVTTKMLQSVVNEILDSGKKPELRNQQKRVCACCKRYVLDGTIALNPANLIQIPKFDSRVSFGYR